MKIKFDKNDLYKCFEFAVKYHLDEAKSNVNRTTGQYRGLGAIVNDFLLGKLIELGVAKGIEGFNSKIKCQLDFDIHAKGENRDSDPDIVKINEKGKMREPKLFVEIKNVSPGDRWIGLSKEQFETIKSNSIVDEKGSKIYLVYASLGSAGLGGDDDLLGSFLKSGMTGYYSSLFRKFCSISDLFIEIKQVLSGEELDKYGTFFSKGSYFYETEIFNDFLPDSIAEKNRKLDFKRFDVSDKNLPIVSRNKTGDFKEFGDFYCKGKANFYIKENEKSNRMYLDCLTDVVIKNRVLGDFRLSKGKMYEAFFETIGRDPILKRNNIFIANRNLSNIVKGSIPKKLDYIAKNI